jgi:hypothetical protein
VGVEGSLRGMRRERTAGCREAVAMTMKDGGR